MLLKTVETMYEIELSKWVIRLDQSWVDDLVSQLNLSHFLASQKNLNPARSITSWRVKWVGSRVHLIKKKIIFLFFSVKTKL